MVAALGTAMLVGLLNPERLRTDSNVVLGVLFSLSMGIAFLGMGLFGRFGVPDNEVRALLWGSLAICQWRHVWLISAVAVMCFAFVLLFGKEMRAVLFSRLHARAAGIHATIVWTGFLVLTAGVLTVNFQTVGGLMIYSLMTNPAVAAFALVKGHGRAMLLATILGAVSGLGGFLIALAIDLPVGPVIVIFSSAIVVVGFGARRVFAPVRPQSRAS
jgi:manganese/iron transport system permease protein